VIESGSKKCSRNGSDTALFPRKANISMIILISIYENGTVMCDSAKTASQLAVAMRIRYLAGLDANRQ
jgi:hypothetical protein